jgi:AcrR family transcriptional regulator
MANTAQGRDRRNDVVELLWGQRHTPTRGPKPSLSVEAIARASVEIADSDGLAALSMQRVAEALGVTKMALYRYIESKAQLLAVTIEAAAGDPPDPSDVPGGWRPRIEEWARLLRATWLQHRWLPGATIGDRVMGPKELGWIEAALGALTGSRLTGHEQMDVVFILCGHIRQTTTVTGTQPWAPDHRLSPSLRQRLQEHPAFSAVLEATEAPSSPDTGFNLGLQLILDGLEHHIAHRRRS